MPLIKPIGSVRQSQAVTTFSVGAIVDFDSGSYMPMGINRWPATVLHGVGSKVLEDRLALLLGKKFFVLPPARQTVAGGSDAEVKSEYALPATLFPEWHFCSHPDCNRLGTLGNPFQVNPLTGRMRCIAHDKDTTPVRFVISCKYGHIDDFPWVEWVHGASSACARPSLRLLTSGDSLSLADLAVVCDGCRRSRTLEGAFKGELSAYECRGRRVWLGDSCACQEPVAVLQRGSSSAHFQVSASALSIPPVSDTLSQVLDEVWSVIESTGTDLHRAIIEGFANSKGLPVEALFSAYQRRKGLIDSNAISPLDIKRQEYSALCSDVAESTPAGGRVPHFENLTVIPVGLIAKWFELVGAVSRLREVRVLTGFTRINPAVGKEPWKDRHMAPLSSSNLDWLPAFEIRGEGVFLKFNRELLNQWSKTPAVMSRVSKLHEMYVMLCASRDQPVDRRITPQEVLIHTFSHAFVRQLAIECGYAAASIRERIYCSESLDSNDDMCGLLIYTGTTDSSGSLGGLVSLAEQSRLEPIILRALESMGWCGSDPVCSEQGPDSMGDKVSGASCHSCVVLPETSCEKGNRELDRILAVGSSEIKGFFE